MNSKVVICFSEEKDLLSKLLIELSKRFGDSVSSSGFHSEKEFLDFLTNAKIADFQIQAIIIDVQKSNNESMLFLNEINISSPNSIKIIISDTILLSEIQLKTENPETFHLLSKQRIGNDLSLTIEFALKNNEQLEIIRSKETKIKDIEARELKTLFNSDIAKDKFISIIAHELKAPFNSLIGISEILIGNWNTIADKEKLNLIKDLHSSSESSYKLLEDLLDWSKSNNGELKANLEPTNIQHLIESTIEVVAQSARIKQIEIKNEIHSEIRVMIDSNMISAVFRNLISNAIKHNQAGSEIKITAYKNHKNCIFCVADNGNGIDKVYILDHFKKENIKPINGLGKGANGLGLILCKDFVERNGGQIWLESQPGNGSKFYFNLPLALA